MLTQAGLVVGSPGFMSPEQATGYEVGPPSDIFTLGAVLAFAATGRGPFGIGETAALLYRVVHGTPTLEGIPPTIRPLVERCLAKDPAQRPTARGVLAEVGALQPDGNWLPDSMTSMFAAAIPSGPVAAASRPAARPTRVDIYPSTQRAQEVVPLTKPLRDGLTPDHKPMFPSRGTPGTLSKLDVPTPQLRDDVPPESTPASASSRIFISYRRDDTAYSSGWLFDKLVQHFGRDQVFKDIDSIQLGDDFAEVITAAVERCHVLLALIGRRWLMSSGKDGRRRLDNPNDFVRLEIEAAITRNVRIIPILVDGAPMPLGDELPASLAKLARRQALELSAKHFDSGISRLLRVLDAMLLQTGDPRC
jgi:hypothetical protein